MSEYLRMSNLQIEVQIYSAVVNDDHRRREAWEEERGMEMLVSSGKKKKRNRKNKCGSQKRGEDECFLEVPPRFDPEIKSKIDEIPVVQEEEKKQEWEEERVKEMLRRSGKKKKRNPKNKCGSQKRGEDRCFLEVPPRVGPEIKARIDEIPVAQGYHMRGRRGQHIYVRKTQRAGCWKTQRAGCWKTVGVPESPPKAVSWFVNYGANFLSKTIEIDPEGSHSTLVRCCADETKIIVKGKDSVCGVSRRSYKDGALEAITLASADPFCFGEEHGFPLESDDYEEMMKPFSRVTFSLDTDKEGCKDDEYIESKGREDTLIEENMEPLCDEDLAAYFNEQKAITYIENKLKQDPVIGHDETIETAITAFKYLLRDGCKSDEIKVYVMGKEWIEKALSVEEIEEFLSR